MSSDSQAPMPFPDDGSTPSGSSRPSATASSSKTPATSVQALKRGSACRRCRQRKIRCSGDRPVCGLCQKDGRECVYDPERQKAPVVSGKDKISALETKISELEKILTGQVAPALADPARAPPPNTSTFPPSVPFQDFSTIDPNNPVYHSLDVAALLSSFQMNDGRSSYSSLETPIASSSSLPVRTTSASNASFPYPSHVPKSKQVSEEERRVAEQQAFMAEIEALFGSSSGGGYSQAVSGWDETLQTPQLALDSVMWPDMLSSDSMPTFGLGDVPPAKPSPRLATNDMDYVDFCNFPPLPTIDNVATPSDTHLTFDDQLQRWVDGGKQGDLPRLVRDQLLETSIRWRRQVALVFFHQNFIQTLDGPQENRPHPGFVWAMITHASRYHPNKLVRSLQEDFFQIAKFTLDQGVSRLERVLDLTRGTALLSAWLFMNGRFHEGFMLSGIASRLSTLCMLHRISWPSIHPETGQAQARWLAQSRKPSQLLPPVKSFHEQIDRSFIFFQCLAMDRVGSIATNLPPSIADHEIETPFPPSYFISFESVERQDQVSTGRKFTVDDLFTENPSPEPLWRDPATVPNAGAFVFMSMCILSRISRLSDHFLQPSMRQQYLSGPAAPMVNSGRSSSFALSSTSPGEAPRGSDIDVVQPIPPEALALEKALNRFVENLPAKFKHTSSFSTSVVDDGRTGFPRDGVIRSLLFLLHSEIHLSYALLYDEQARFDHARYWPRCVASARSIVQLIRMVGDVDWGHLDVMVGICWREVSQILSMEARLQRAAGNEEIAQGVEREVEVLVLSMERLSSIFDLPSPASSS